MADLTGKNVELNVRDVNAFTNVADGEYLENLRLVKMRKDAQDANRKKFEANVKARLINNIAKKFKTTYIGALASFEEGFGHLWGYGKAEEDLTKEERQYAEIWSAVRTEVLNKGNNNSRAAQDEISQHDVVYNKFTATNLLDKEKGN